jgi:hypothetical protein
MSQKKCVHSAQLCTDRHRQRRSPNLSGNKLSKFGDFRTAIDGEISAIVLRTNSAAHDIFSSVLLIIVRARQFDTLLSLSLCYG